MTLSGLFLVCLAVYFVFHLVSQSDLFEKVRRLARTVLPSWLTYPLDCAFCFTFHTLWVLEGLLWMTGNTDVGIESVILLLTAPVINLVLDLAVRSMRRYASGSMTMDEYREMWHRSIDEEMARKIRAVGMTGRGVDQVSEPPLLRQQDTHSEGWKS